MMEKLSEDIIEALELLRYPKVESLLTNGSPRSLSIIEFSAIVNWLSDELNDMLRHDHIVNVLTSEKELDAFKIELNSLLRQLHSPFIGFDITIEKNRLAVINYLCGELMASRILYVKKPADGGMKIDMYESDTAKELKASMIILGIGKPPANVQSSQLFSKMQDRINERLKKSTLSQEEPLLIKPGTQLVPKEWKTLEKINSSLYEDYHVRRETLITRLDCTIGSFKWKEGENKTTDFGSRIDTAYGKLRVMLDPKPTVSLAHGLAAKSGCFDILNSVVSKSRQICDIEAPKTKGMANAGKQQRISLQKFLIGNVPDRGGRPKEQPPPAQETFQQQQNQRQQPRGGGNQRGGSSGGGYQQRNQSHGDSGGGQYQQRQQFNQRDHGDQPYHQQPRQFYGDKSHHSFNQPRGHYQDNQHNYQQQSQPNHNYDNHRGGYRGGGGGSGGRGRGGGYQDHGHRGGGRVQGAGWNQQGYQRY